MSSDILYIVSDSIREEGRVPCLSHVPSRRKNNAGIVVFRFGFGLVRFSILMSFYLTGGRLNNDRWICKCEDNESGSE